MGTFSDDRAALDEAFLAGDDRIAVLLDGQAPAPKSAPAAAPAPVAVTSSTPKPAPADTGPGFWSRLGSGLSAVGGNLVDIASKVEFTPAPISGARANAVANLPPPPPAVPWRVLAVVAGAVVVLAMLLRRPSPA